MVSSNGASLYRESMEKVYIMNSNKVSLIVTSSIIDVIFDGELPQEVFQRLKEQIEVTTNEQHYLSTLVSRAIVERGGIIERSFNRIRIIFDYGYITAKAMFANVIKALEDEGFVI